jgi:DNA recombination-dependent growth factor C
MTTLHIKYITKKLDSLYETLENNELNDEVIRDLNERIFKLNTQLELKLAALEATQYREKLERKRQDDLLAIDIKIMGSFHVATGNTLFDY